MRIRPVGGSALLAALGVVAVGAAAWPFTVDDTFIVARYAHHLMRGLGYVMNVGGPATDGVTGPAWLLPMMGGVAWAKALGLACGAVAAALAATLAGKRGGPWAGWGAALFVAVQPTLGIWGAAGLGTGAGVLLVTVAAWGALAPVPRPVLVGLAAAIVPWLRPEAVPAVLAATGLLWARQPRGARWALLAGGAGVVSVLLFRGVLFGHALPLAVAAKPPSLRTGFEYVGRGLLATTGVAALIPVAWGARRGDRWVRGAVLVAAVHLGAAVVAGGDWMPGYRLLAPALPVLAVALGGGLARVSRPWLRAALLVAACAVPVADAAVQLPDVREAGLRRVRVGGPFGRWLGQRYDHVGLVDAGYLPWVGGFRVLDLAGLTDPRVARLPGGHLDKRLPSGLLAEAIPDAFVLHAAVPPEVDGEGRLATLAGYPVERRIAADPWVRAHYRVERVLQYSPTYHYVVLARAPPAP